MLRVGDTLVPLIIMSEGTHLLNFARDKAEWPVYMAISNLSSKFHQMPSTHSIVLVPHLLIPIKNRNIPQKRLNEQQQTNREMLNEVLWWVLQPLSFKQHPSAESSYFSILCADGNFRHCQPGFAAWLADCPEGSDLHHLEQHVGVQCKCPKNKLEHYVPLHEEHPWWDHNLYRSLSDDNTRPADAELSSRHDHWG